MKKSLILLLIVFLAARMVMGQTIIDHLEPPFWWVGMKQNSLQLMVHGAGIGNSRAEAVYPGLKVLQSKASGDNYLFIDLELSKEVKAGKFNIRFMKGGKVMTTYSYQLKSRATGSANRNSFNTADAIYLLMPDRFANGDPGNDDMPGMLEKADRSNKNGRHGGDLKGIISGLEYMKGMGITALWMTPLQENNMPKFSYHGYAITDLYKVDPRFGSNSDYCEMVAEAHQHGIKVIMDIVFNHFGSSHWWMKDLPSPTWIHQWPEFTRSNYRAGVINDPHQSDYDRKKMLNGWFDTTMPDFDQANPNVATYLIQNSIWWIEYAGLDGIRQDTYPYSDKDFMVRWMKRLREEYPNFNVVGEAWLNTPPQVAYWLEGSANNDKFNSNLTNVFDFPLMFAIQQAFNEEDGWANGMAKLYDIISQDFLYSDVKRLVTFSDNHDIDRMTSMLKSTGNVKMALALLCTTRGIPLFYYGTEIMMPGMKSDGDGNIRRDFPGGWLGDSINVFQGNNLSADQKDVSAYFATLLNWRKGKHAVQEGRLVHYIPENGMYVYFRILGKEQVMVILNNNKMSQDLGTMRYREDMKGFSGAKDALTGELLKDLKSINVPAKSARILELTP